MKENKTCKLNELPVSKWNPVLTVWRVFHYAADCKCLTFYATQLYLKGELCQ